MSLDEFKALREATNSTMDLSGWVGSVEDVEKAIEKIKTDKGKDSEWLLLYLAQYHNEAVEVFRAFRAMRSQVRLKIGDERHTIYQINLTEEEAKLLRIR